MPLEVGKTVDGKVLSITSFGAFVELPEGKTGLVHISEVALRYVQNIRDHISENEAVRVKILSIDERGKINLSIKKVLEEERKSGVSKPRPARPPEDIDWSRQGNSNNSLSFEDMLSKFKQESEDKINSLKNGKETKRNRNGGGKKLADML